MINDLPLALIWGVILAFTIGPVFFILLETSITKGFRAAFSFDLGVVFADVVFILIAYFSTQQFLEVLQDDPLLFIIGGCIMFMYGVYSFIRQKRNFFKEQSQGFIDEKDIKSNYLSLFFKGFLLNFINIGVLIFWMIIIIGFGAKFHNDNQRLLIFLSVILLTYLLIDILKILIAKQLKNRLTPFLIYKIKKVISIILIIFGLFLVIQGFFPVELQQKIETFSTTSI